MIKQKSDPRVKVINFDNNGVIGASRNVGINSSSSDFVAFLDSDDIWFDQKLEKVVEAIKANPEIGVLCHNQILNWYDGTVQQSDYGPGVNGEEDLYKYLLLTRNCLSTSATVKESML